MRIVSAIKKPAYKEFKILAIDPATNCGWAMSSSLYGCWNLSKKDDNWGMRLVRLKAKLNELMSLEGFKLLAYERPMGSFKNSTATGYRIVGLIEAFCIENDVALVAYSPGEVKKFATGNGSAKKDKMIAAAKSKYGYQGKNDNEADALHLLHLAKSDLFK